jgi:hypothetical protein
MERDSTGREITAALPLKHNLLLICVFAALLLYVWPYARAWLIERAEAELHNSLLTDCRIPTEHEQLHVVVVSREGRLFGRCMHVGPRGAYDYSRRSR